MVVSMDRWVGKVAIVTGASCGIGAAIAEKFVEEGLIVVGIARRSDLIEENSKKLSGKKGKLYAIKADLTKEEDILKAFDYVTKNIGHVHILINNAGTTMSTNLSDGDTAIWKTILDLNVLGLCIATREAIKNMKAQNIAGHIVHINSVAGHTIQKLPKNMNMYPASKFAVTALTETLRQELNHCNSKIKVTSVSPSIVETELTTLSKNETPQRKFFENLPMLKADDIADGVLYVLSTPEHVQVHELTIRPVGDKL